MTVSLLTNYEQGADCYDWKVRRRAALARTTPECCSKVPRRLLLYPLGRAQVGVHGMIIDFVDPQVPPHSAPLTLPPSSPTAIQPRPHSPAPTTSSHPPTRLRGQSGAPRTCLRSLSARGGPWRRLSEVSFASPDLRRAGARRNRSHCTHQLPARAENDISLKVVAPVAR